MKKFKTFLTELAKPTTWTEYESIINNKCQPFLKELGGMIALNNRPLLRGMRPKDTAEVAIRKDRKPLNSSSFEHKAMVKFFVNNFKINHREESVMTTSLSSSAGAYGAVHVVFPVGDFKYVYSDIKGGDDVTYLLRDKMSESAIDLASLRGIDPNSEEYELFYEKNRFKIATIALSTCQFTDDNLRRGMDKGAEIMINCDTYIAVPEDIWNSRNK